MSCWVIALLAAFGGCQRRSPQLSPTKLPEVVIALPVSKDVLEFEEFTGRTDALLSVEIRSRVTGYLDKVNFKDGADVQQGELLFEIDDRWFRAEVERAAANVAQAQAHQQRLNLDYDRAMKLLAQNAISQEQADRATYDRAEAEAALSSAQASLDLAQLNLSYTRITAPINGRISRRLVDPGNLVKADETPLTTIVSLDPLYAYFDVDERTLLRLRRLVAEGKIPSTRDSEVKVEIGLADEQGFSLSGIINFVDNRLEANTGTLRTRAIIDNSWRILSPGLFVRVRLPIGQPRPSVLVPEQAVGSDQGQKFLYVLNQKDEVVYRPVKVGLLDDRLRVIESGVTLQDRVVVSGQQRVRPGVKVHPAMAESVAHAAAAPESQAGQAAEATPKADSGSAVGVARTGSGH